MTKDRGYYYDADLGMYYLQSRYYDQNTGRFINPDSYVSTGQELLGNNMYVYCGNNPVNRIDLNGYGWEDVKNWFVKTYNDVKETVTEFVEIIEEEVYSVYYKFTKRHFEDRAEKNGTHPTYYEVNEKDSEWTLLPEEQSIYHDNGVGLPELKYITDDGREAVF